MLTPLEKKILTSISLIPEPYYPQMLAHKLRRPVRGVINSLGRLVSQNILIKKFNPTRYYFRLPEELSQWNLSLNPDAVDVHTRAWWQAWQQWNPDKSIPGYHIIRTALASCAGYDLCKEILADAFDSVFKQMNVNEIQIIIDRFYTCFPAEMPDELQGRIEEFQLSVSTSFVDSILNSKRLSIDKKDIVKNIWLLQENGLEEKAEGLLVTLKTDRTVFHNPFLVQWLSARQLLLSGRFNEARELLTSLLKNSRKLNDRYKIVLVLFEIARMYGMQKLSVKEQRALERISYFLKFSKVPSLTRLYQIKYLEHLVETGRNQEALQEIQSILSHVNNTREDSGEFFVAATFGLLIACRLNRIHEARYYVNDLLMMVEKLPLELLFRVYCCVEEFSKKDSGMFEKRKTTLLKYMDWITDPDDLKSLSLNSYNFLRMSHLSCDAILKQIDNASDKFSYSMQQAAKHGLMLSRKLNDHERWIEIARHFTEMQMTVSRWDDVAYPTGYSGWLNRLLTSLTMKEFRSTVQKGLKSILGIESGAFIIENSGQWKWFDLWGKKPDAGNRRAILQQLDAAGWKDNVVCSEWIATVFPENSPVRGYLCIHLVSKYTSESAFSEIQSGLQKMVRPIAIVRFLLTNNHHGSITKPEMLKAGYVEKIIGQSPGILQLKKDIVTVSQRNTTVHITGETGVGKELVAQAIHEKSDRKKEVFVAFNCSTSTETIIDSELFGHCRGAFTGAVTERKGVFQTANKGTLFLDEVADLPLNTQAKLLRVLQERSVRPVGSDTYIDVDVRIISATHKNLNEEITEGRFRKDLYFRLVVVKMNIPPLRDRSDDILRLAEYFLWNLMEQQGSKMPDLSSCARKWLLNYHWPGNIRELQNLMEVCATFAIPGSTIKSSDLVRWSGSHSSNTELSLFDSTAAFQKAYIQKKLAFCGGNLTKTAEKLGISRQGLFKKMKSLGIITGNR